MRRNTLKNKPQTGLCTCIAQDLPNFFLRAVHFLLDLCARFAYIDTAEAIMPGQIEE